jgi:hypothetical protein
MHSSAGRCSTGEAEEEARAGEKGDVAKGTVKAEAMAGDAGK